MLRRDCHYRKYLFDHLVWHPLPEEIGHRANEYPPRLLRPDRPVQSRLPAIRGEPYFDVLRLLRDIGAARAVLPPVERLRVAMLAPVRRVDAVPAALARIAVVCYDRVP